jgi:four helix bundle protein
MRDFRQLKVWQKAHQLVLGVYKVARQFPKEETYGLSAQIRRASVSIAANIVEGNGRGSDAEMARFLQIALGSACELEYELLLSQDLEYLTAAAYAPLASDVTETKRMLSIFIKKLKAVG